MPDAIDACSAGGPLRTIPLRAPSELHALLQRLRLDPKSLAGMEKTREKQPAQAKTVKEEKEKNRTHCKHFTLVLNPGLNAQVDKKRG